MTESAQSDVVFLQHLLRANARRREGPCDPVQPWRVDITDEVTLGASNTLEYRGLFGGQPPGPSHGRIRMNTYVVYYED